VVANQIPRFVARVLGVSWLLAFAKPFDGIHLIAMGEVFYQLMNKVLCL